MPEMGLIAAASGQKLKYEIIRLAMSVADGCGILKPNPKLFFFFSLPTPSKPEREEPIIFELCYGETHSIDCECDYFLRFHQMKLI